MSVTLSNSSKLAQTLQPVSLKEALNVSSRVLSERGKCEGKLYGPFEISLCTAVMDNSSS